MKKLLVLLLVISFCFSCSEKKEKENTANEELKSEPAGCPECIAEFNKCSDSIHTAYASVIEEENEKLKYSDITEEQYKAICDEAYNTMKAAIEECDTAFENCCLEE